MLFDTTSDHLAVLAVLLLLLHQANCCGVLNGGEREKRIVRASPGLKNRKEGGGGGVKRALGRLVSVKTVLWCGIIYTRCIIDRLRHHGIMVWYV